MREDLVQSAVSFLSDPKVQSAPLAKKVSFLESKGLTAEEIEEAMTRVSGKSTGASTPTVATASSSAAPVVYAPPPVPQRPVYDWRDVFIGAVLAGGISYGVWTLAKKLFGPWFQVPTQKELDEDKERLDQQFQAVEESLKKMKEQTSGALAKVSDQSKKVDESIASLENVLKDLKQGDAQRDEEFKHVKADVMTLKDLVPTMLDRIKEAQAHILNDLQNEVKSLKSLLMARNRPASSLLEQATSSTSEPGSPASPITRLSATLNSNTRPGIPAWQLAATSTTKSGDTQQAESSSSDQAETSSSTQ